MVDHLGQAAEPRRYRPGHAARGGGQGRREHDDRGAAHMGAGDEAARDLTPEDAARWLAVWRHEQA